MADTPAFIAHSDGRFRFRRVLGRGGYAEVSLVEDLLLGREVAVKQLLPQRLSAETVEQVTQEARIAARISHPNVIATHDVVMIDDMPALVMEYIDGRSLKMAAVDMPWTLGDRLEVLEQVCAGVGAIHAEGVAHGDLRPENVLISSDSQVKVTDFGVSALRIAPGQSSTDSTAQLADSFSLADDLKAMVAMVRYVVPPRYQTPFAQTVIGDLDKCRNIDDMRAALLSVRDNLTQLETAVTPPPARVVNWRRRLVFHGVLAVGLLLVASTVLLDFHRRSQQSVGVLLDEPVLLGGERLSEAQLRYVSDSVRTGLETAVLADQGLHLYRQLAAPTGAPVDVAYKWRLTPQIDCDASRCVIRVEKTAPGVQTREVSRSLPFAPDAAATVFNAIPDLLSELRLMTQKTRAVSSLDDQTLLLFHERYRDAHYGGMSCERLLPDIDALKAANPDFSLVYHLGMHCALEVFYDTGERASVQKQSADLLGFLFRNPDASPGNYEPLIFSYSDTGDFPAAWQAIDEARSKGADWWSLAYWEAYVLSTEGRYDEASERYQSLMAAAPSQRVVFSAAHNAYYSGDVEAALALAHRAIEQYEPRAKVFNFLGMTYLNQGEYTLAKNFLEQAVDLGEERYFRSNLALTYLMAGDWQGSLDAHQQLLDEGAFHPNVALNHADSLNALGRPERARRSYELVLEVTADDAPIEHRFARAQALAHLGRHEQAIGLVQGIRDELGESAHLSYAASVVFVLAGDLQSAVFAAQSSLDQGLDLSWYAFPWFAPLCEPLTKVQSGAGAHRCGASQPTQLLLVN